MTKMRGTGPYIPTEVTLVRYHQDAWLARGGLWIIECDGCWGYGHEFEIGYPTRERATRAAVQHRCHPAAAAQREADRDD